EELSPRALVPQERRPGPPPRSADVRAARGGQQLDGVRVPDEGVDRGVAGSLPALAGLGLQLIQEVVHLAGATVNDGPLLDADKRRPGGNDVLNHDGLAHCGPLPLRLRIEVPVADVEGGYPQTTHPKL